MPDIGRMCYLQSILQNRENQELGITEACGGKRTTTNFQKLFHESSAPTQSPSLTSGSTSACFFHNSDRFSCGNRSRGTIFWLVSDLFLFGWLRHAVAVFFFFLWYASFWFLDLTFFERVVVFVPRAALFRFSF